MLAGPEPGEVLDVTEGEAQLLSLLDVEPRRRTAVLWADDTVSAAQVAQFTRCAPNTLRFNELPFTLQTKHIIY